MPKRKSKKRVGGVRAPEPTHADRERFPHGRMAFQDQLRHATFYVAQALCDQLPLTHVPMTRQGRQTPCEPCRDDAGQLMQGMDVSILTVVASRHEGARQRKVRAVKRKGRKA